jgi:hypothetical protein
LRPTKIVWAAIWTLLARAVAAAGDSAAGGTSKIPVVARRASARSADSRVVTGRIAGNALPVVNTLAATTASSARAAGVTPAAAPASGRDDLSPPPP